MSLIAKLVADRYARRTIQFDHQAVSLQGAKLAEKALDRIGGSEWPDKTLREQMDPFEIYASTTLRLNDVQGQNKVLRASVRARSDGRDHSPVLGGDLNTSYGIINLYLNEDWTPNDLRRSRRQIVRHIASFLVHEVTHALDIMDPSRYITPGLGLEAYYNQPSEFRAYSKQVIAEALTALSHYKGSVLPLSELVEHLLDSSEIFRDKGRYFNRSNQKRLRQMLVREIQNSGVL